jgi:DNA/RNA endonuclease YhcR with UshA esterase domain
VHAVEPGEIIITEIMPNPKAVSDTNGEWFEIYNSSSSTINLIDCEIKDAGTNSFTITDNLNIDPESYLVFGRKEDTTINGGLTVNYTYASFTLANTVDQIILICAGQEIDKVEYSKALGFPLPDGASLMLPDLILDNNVGANWCISSTPYGDGDMGTPGSENDICAQASSGGSSSSSSSNRPPRPEAGADIKSFINETIKFDGSGSGDPDGDKLNYSWNFGDGTTGIGKTTNHTYASANIYLVTLTVDDGKIAINDSLAVSIKEGKPTISKGELIISEFLPNPIDDGELEWIELQNVSEKNLDLQGISLQDLSEKIFTFTYEKIFKSVLAPEEFLLIPRATSTIALNNTPPETIFLLDQNKQIIDEITYNDTALAGYSYALIDHEWQWTELPTPGTSNTKKTILEEDIFTDGQNIEKELLVESDSVANINIPVCVTTPSAQILINELWPSPDSDDRQYEFIELKNLDNIPVNLCGWKIKDNSTTFTLPVGYIIEPHNFLVIPRSESNISLNNTGDTISLYNSDDNLIDQTNYSSAKTNISWSRKNNNSWEWTTEVTPGEENILSGNLQMAANINNQVATYIPTPINKIASFDINDNVIITGVITALPGLLGSQIMYLQNNGGLQIYQYNKDWPDLNLGDEVEIRGTLSFPYGQPRLKVKNKDDIKIIKTNNNATVSPITLTIDKIEPLLNGTLITIAGTLIEKTNNKLFIDDGTGEIEIYIKSSTGISLPDLTEGDIIEATGIFESNDTSERLLPRYSNDIARVKVAGYNYTTSTKNETVKANYDLIDYLYLTGLALIIILAIKIYQLKNPHGQPKTK